MCLRKELEQINIKIASTERKYLTQPDISTETYSAVIAELKAAQNRIQGQIAEASTNINVYFERINSILPKLINVKSAFEEMDLPAKQKFVAMVFNQNLYYSNDSYRTPSLNNIFSDKALILKEKGLLKIEQPPIKLSQTPLRAPERN